MNINYISPNLRKGNSIPSKVLNPEEILNLLDHDKPEGDNVLENITGIIDTESELNAVELKKSSQIRRF